MKVSFDSKSFEQDLCKAIAACNEFMSKNRGAEPFYGFAMEIGGELCDFGVYYATESLFQACLQRYLKDKYGKIYRKDKEKRWKLRWNPGDWPYSSYWPEPPELRDLMNMKRWCEDPDELVERGDEYWDEYEFKLIESSARALTKLQKNGGFNTLPRTDEFRILLMAHDEPRLYSYLRLEGFQQHGTLLMPWNEYGTKFSDKEENSELQKALASYKE
jgi:hypothetical protein